MSASMKGNKNDLGHKHSAETRAKISAAKKGKTLSAETKAKMSAAKAKPVNIYCYKTHELIAENVVIAEYCVNISHEYFASVYFTSNFYSRHYRSNSSWISSETGVSDLIISAISLK